MNHLFDCIAFGMSPQRNPSAEVFHAADSRKVESEWRLFVSVGSVGLIALTRIVEDDIEDVEVDGVRMVLQTSPGTEATSNPNN